MSLPCPVGAGKLASQAGLEIAGQESAVVSVAKLASGVEGLENAAVPVKRGRGRPKKTVKKV